MESAGFGSKGLPNLNPLSVGLVWPVKRAAQEAIEVGSGVPGCFVGWW